MTAALYTFPVSRDLQAARAVMADPKAHPADVVETALTVLDWHGTDEDRARIAGRTAAQLAAARRVALIAGKGERQSLPTLLTAREVLETHGAADDSAALVQIEASAMLKRMQARKPVSRPRLLVRMDDAAVMIGAAWAIGMIGYVAWRGL